MTGRWHRSWERGSLVRFAHLNEPLEPEAFWPRFDPTIVVAPLAWMDDAACLTSSMDFTSEASAPAKAKVCGGCVSREKCLEHAIAENIQHGVWGGLTGPQRRRAGNRPSDLKLGFLYAVRFADLVKVGFSTKPTERISHLRYSYGFSFNPEILTIVPGTMADEYALHHALSEWRAHGDEWYQATPELLGAIGAMTRVEAA